MNSRGKKNAVAAIVKENPAIEICRDLDPLYAELGIERIYCRFKPRAGFKKVLSESGGKRIGSAIRFGSPTDTQLSFKVGDGGTWIVEAEFWPFRIAIDLKKDLNKSGRALWKEDSQTPTKAFIAAKALLKCWTEFEAKPSNADEILAVQQAIVTTLAAFDEDNQTPQGRKLQLSHRLLTEDQLGLPITKLLESCLILAAELQRPPLRKELEEKYDPVGSIDGSNFSKLLEMAGLRWLRDQRRPKAK